LWVNYVLVGVDVDVLVLRYFEGDEVIGHHVADNFQLGVFLRYDLGYWMVAGVHLRKV